MVMNGTLVGKRLIGTQAPVTVGWENLPRVEGGPVKLFVFTWFQPAMLIGLIAFWFYAPNSITKTAVLGRHALFRPPPRPNNWNMLFRASVERLAAFPASRPIRALLGAHIDMSAAPRQDSYRAALPHRSEHPLAAPPGAVETLWHAAAAQGGTAMFYARPDFILYPHPPRLVSCLRRGPR
jgi:hypothetical protein